MTNIVFKLLEAVEQPFSEVGKYPSEIMHYSTNGLKVPDSLIIPSSTVWKHFSDCKLAEIWSDQISKLDANSIDPKSLEILSEPIIAQIMKSDLSEEFRIELSKGYSNLSSFSDSFVNVRLCTDSPVFDSNKTEKKTNLKSFDNVVLGIKEVLASIFQSELLYDFYTLQISPFTLELPILIQKSIQSEVSGIAFNLSPIDHDLEKIQIEAIVGNIEPLLNHEIIPDNYVLKKDTLEIIDQFISKQEWMQIRSNPKQPGTNSNIKIAVSKSWQNKPKLENHLMLELAEHIRLLSENNPMASVQINWGLENGEFWLFDIKDLLKIESNINRGFNKLGSNKNVTEVDQSEDIDEVEIIRPKTIELFESSFIDEDDQIEESHNVNIIEEKKPSRKGIVIKNNEVVDPGDSTTVQSTIIPPKEDILLRDKAKQILYGKEERNIKTANEGTEIKSNVIEKVNDIPLFMNEDTIVDEEFSTKQDLVSDKEVESDLENHSDLNEIAEIEEVDNNNSFSDEIITDAILAEEFKQKSLGIVNIAPFITPLINSRRTVISNRIKALLKQKEAYNILYKKDVQKDKKENDAVKPNLESENRINLISKPSETQNIFENHFQSNIPSSEELRPLSSRTATKLFSEISQITKLSKEEIIESDGGVIIDYQKGNSLSTAELINFSQLFTPKMLVYRISTHQDIKYTNSNIGSIDDDLKSIKAVRAKGMKNIHICIPYLKSAEEFEFFREYFYSNGVKQSHNSKLFASIDNIFILHNIDKLIDSGIDGIIFNVEEILRISLGVTKEKFLEQKENVLNEYKISETGIKDMIDNVSATCKKRKIPFILNLSNFTGDNLDDLSNIAVTNHAFAIQINIKSIEKLRTVVKYYEEKHISKIR